MWEFLDSATGDESTKRRNREALDRILFRPAVMRGKMQFDLTTEFLGRTHPMPVGIAPIGMSGLMWPDAERTLARFAAKSGLPYNLSNAAAETPEAVGKVAGEDAWFQLYPAADREIRDDIVFRARDAGFKTLVVTVDLPASSRRERQVKSGLTQPPRITPRIALQCALRPEWSMGILQSGRPRLKTFEKYSTQREALSSTEHIGYLIRGNPDWTYIEELREIWDGPFVVKGVLEAEDAARIKSIGCEAVWVSNHAGRQFAGAPGAIDMLPPIREAVGPDYPLIFDSGIKGGLDVLRATAWGADFVMLGRAWHFALAALGPRGLTHLEEVLKADMISNMAQIGIERPAQASERLYAG